MKRTYNTQEAIEQACKRYVAGESVAVLAKYYGVSLPAVYVWINKYKARKLEAFAATAPDTDLSKRVRFLERKMAEMVIRLG